LPDETVVMLYGSNSLNMRLRAIGQRQLTPEWRVVSHTFPVGDWKPESEQHLEGTTISLWTIPPR
jgi:hypothetical protein